MEIFEAEKLLNKTQFERFTGTLQKIILKGFEYDSIFRIGNDGMGYFALKIRKNDIKNVTDSINYLKTVNDKEHFINENIGAIEKDNQIITITKWLNGKQPIDNNRDSLPVFFSKLAVFNKNNIINGPYTSMYLDGNHFDGSEELIDWEINYHQKYFFEKWDAKILIEILKNLKHGFSCIIIEDIHPGNLFITDDGQYRIIDTEWVIKGINLYQFQHIDYFGFEEKTWYNITDEAKDCYQAYFDALGTGNEESNEQIRAIELLNVLRGNTYLKYSGKENDAEIGRRIKIILEREKFI